MTAQAPPLDLDEATEVVLADGRGPLAGGPTMQRRRVYVQVAAMTALVLLVVGVVGAVLGRQQAERESEVDATRRAGVLAAAVVQPAIWPGLLEGDPVAAAVLDDAVRRLVLSDAVVRVKLWRVDGRIIYSDEPRLVGERFPLDAEEQAILLGTAEAVAEHSDLSRPENRYEAGLGDLIEVYARVNAPDGQPLMFEAYIRDAVVNDRTGEIWRNLTAVTYASLGLLLLLLLPVIWQLLSRLRRVQEQRELLWARAAENSSADRRRIAATLHDGVAQDLAATAFVLAGAGASAVREGRSELAADLEHAAGAVRNSIASLRSLLVDIYPPSLTATGLDAVLVDLVACSGRRDLRVTLELPPTTTAPLDPEGERLIFRVAQECLRNAVRHAAAQTISVQLADTGPSRVLTVSDDGTGFRPDEVLLMRSRAQTGLSLLADESRAGGADLRIRSAPGRGTRCRLEVPLR